jgi:hypothetical protein
VLLKDKVTHLLSQNVSSQESEKTEEETYAHGLFLHIFTTLIETHVQECNKITRATTVEVHFQHHQPIAVSSGIFILTVMCENIF